MKYDVFFCGEGVEFASQLVQISVYNGCAATLGALEDRMFYEMRNAAMVTDLIAADTAEKLKGEA